MQAAGARPVVVELFTAQGCGSCPEADALLAGLVNRKGVIALAFSVDYWDYLGWRDTLAMPAFTARQRAYADRLKLKEIYTPEIVVDGRREAPGLDRDRIDSLIKRHALEADDPPEVHFLRHGSKVEIGDADEPSHPLDVWLVRYDPEPRSVKVKAGDNKGKSVTVRNAVRQIARLGSWRGDRRVFTLPASPEKGLDSVVLVQGAKGGRIVAAAKA